MRQPWRAAASALLAIAVGACRPASPPPAALEPCSLEGIPGAARCGVVSVPEDRSDPRGRRIGLRVVVLEPTGGDPAPDPVYALMGGPGAGAAAASRGLARQYALLRERRALVLVDSRGTGASAPLRCEPLDDPAVLFGVILPREWVRRCREELSQRARLDLYRTETVVADLDAVRDALGHERINLVGGSYASRAAMHYARRFPERVRALSLMALAPVSTRGGESYGPDLEAAIGLLVRECGNDPACSGAYPGLGEELREAFRQLRAEPAAATIASASGEAVVVRYGAGDLAYTLRGMLYGPGAWGAPRLLHRAHLSGSWDELAQIYYDRWRGLSPVIAIGHYLSVICAEDAPRGPEDPERGPGGLEAGYLRRQYHELCRIWDVPEAPDSFREPVVSDRPVLLFSGGLDSSTPPRRAEEVLASLANSRHVVFPQGGHGYLPHGDECRSEIERAFIESASVEGLDLSCVAAVEPARFDVSE